MRVPDCLDKFSKKVAKRLLRKLLKKQGWAPRVMLTDKLKICPAAKREAMPGVEQRQQNGLNNRAENRHQPTRRREGHVKLLGRPAPGSPRRRLIRAITTKIASDGVFGLPPLSPTLGEGAALQVDDRRGVD